MKHFSLFLLLVASYAHCNAETHRHRFTHVAGTEVIDGHTPGVNADVVAKILQIRNAINRLLQDKKYDYQGTLIALSDLTTIFADLEKNGINHNDESYRAAQHCLSDMIEDLIRFTDAFVENEAPFIQKMVSKIIHNWAHRSGRHNSLLLQWGAVDEKEVFRKISAEQLGQFCLDLKNFLYDLLFSCPKAREQFKEKYLTEKSSGQNYLQKRQAFDRSFQVS